ncbi:MAG: FAD-binding oxidoreductase [Candidatus Wildermuthbacteria bacterium]|nr:FAD-binding oxidoreductase [Candidatus Wildermuthbacteria bacterium]
MVREKFGIAQQISIWWDRRRDGFPSGAIEGEVAKVAIVGGGLAGVLTALWLVLLGMEDEVLILEQDGLAGGASGRNGGHVNPGNIPVETISRLHGREAAKAWLDFEITSARLLEEFIERFHIRCGLRNSGYVFLAKEEGELLELQERRALLELLDHPPELWDAQQCTEAGFPGFAGGLFKPQAAQVHPVQLILGLADAARQRGVQIRVMTEVYDITPQEGGGFILTTSKGNVRAEIVVHATNRPFLGEAATALAPGFLPIRGQLTRFYPVPHREIGFGTADGLVYGLWRGKGLLLGGMRHISPSREEGETDDSRVNPVIGRALRSYAIRDLGLPENARVTNEWTGIMWESPDGLPVVGRLPGAHDQYVICGFGGHGFPGIPGAARALAQMIVRAGEQPNIPRLFTPRLERFTRSA